MYSDIKNLKGETIGHWTILEDVGRASNNEVRWKCRCQCGTLREVCGGKLRQGNSKSCGCVTDKHDISGQKVGGWKVVRRTRDHEGNAKWLCRKNGITVLLDKSMMKRAISKADDVGYWIPVGVSGDVMKNDDREWVLGSGFAKGKYVMAKCSQTGIVAVFKKDDFDISSPSLHIEKKRPKTTAEDLSGKKYGTWSVIDKVGHNKHGQAMWKCRCEKCGKIDEKAGFAVKRSPGCRNCNKVFGRDMNAHVKGAVASCPVDEVAEETVEKN